MISIIMISGFSFNIGSYFPGEDDSVVNGSCGRYQR